jgi:hypothetical protein
MEADRSAVARSGQPRPLLLVLLGLAVVAFFLLRTDMPGAPAGAPGRPGAAPPPGAVATIDPAAIDIHLEALTAERPVPAATARNPFRFQAAAAAPQAAYRAPVEELSPPMSSMPPAPMGPPARPITVRFIGVMEHRGETFAIFSECTGGRGTSHARAGEIVDGRYRLVRVGMESVVIEHLDGTGRTTLAQTGQECVR